MALSPSPRLLPASNATYPGYLSLSITSIYHPSAASPTNCNTVGDQNEECQAGFDETQGGPGCQGDENFDIPQGTAPYIGEAVGYDIFSGGCNPGQDISYYAFDTSALNPSMHIISAVLTAWIKYGADFNCSDTHPLRVKLTSVIDKNTSWNNPPGVNVNNQTQDSTVTSGPNPNSNCAVQADSFPGMGYAMAMAAAQNWPVATFGFYGGSDSQGLDWMRIGDFPDIVTTFDITSGTHRQPAQLAARQP